jgi:hypothetical protein
MEQDEIETSTKDLIDRVQSLFEAELGKDADTTPILECVLTLFSELRLDPERAGAAQQSVCRHLSRALDLGEAGPAASVARAIRELEPALHWRQNPKYNAKNMGAGFMDNYAFTDFGLSCSTALYMGVVLLGPGVTYPLTAYPSEGVFLVIGGSPDWKLGDEPWARVEAGSIIGREAGGAEGKRPGEEPMLALYAWLYQ